ncbi:MAG: hypothetical protein QOJ79_3619 [Actinomycetota bacterium]|jgi:hypothetical protein|nr:hypothetical protein [Actinomycetota bacterium]
MNSDDGAPADDDRDGLHDLLVRWGQRERAAIGTAPVAAVEFTRRRLSGWLAVAAAALIGVAVAVGAAVLGSGRSATGPADQPGASPSATSSPDRPQSLAPVDGPLAITPIADAQPTLSRQQAEVIMLNSWPPPPLRTAGPYDALAGSVRMGLASVRLSGEVRRVRGEVPSQLQLAWVVTWMTPDGSRDCPTPGVLPKNEPTSRLDAYVLADDGSTAYIYSAASESCQTAQQAPELASATVQRAVNRIAVPWDGSRRDANGDVLMSFDRPTCATASAMFDPDGAIVFVEVPIGTTCAETVRDSIRTGPTEPAHHPLLGPFRTANGVPAPPLTE